MEEEEELNNLNSEEVSLYFQIQSYIKSQEYLKDLINNNANKEIELYLINDDWLIKWKKIALLDYYDFKDIKNWSENRKNLKLEKNNLEKINNKDLIRFNNKSISELNLISFKPEKYFHLVTKDCFDSFTEGIEDKEFQKLKFKFIAFNKKIMTQSDNQIIALFKSNGKLNLVVFILENVIYKDFYDIIKDSDMVKFLKNAGIKETTKEKTIEIKIGRIEYKAYYMNKSYIYNFKKEDIFYPNFIELIKRLINFDNEFKKMILEKNKINKNQYYLIDKDWIENIKKRLNYFDCNNHEKDINQSIEKMINYYYDNQSGKEEEIEQVNEDRKIINYLLQNDKGKIIKFYNNYTIINEQIWEIITNLFNYHNKIKVECYSKGNLFIIIYNNKYFEILRFLENRFDNNLLLLFYKDKNIENIVKEIITSKASKNILECINITQTNQIFKKIIDQENPTMEIGIAINIKMAVAENNCFKVIKKEAFGEESEFEIGLNKSLSETRIGFLNIYRKSLIFENDEPKSNRNKMRYINTYTKIKKSRNNPNKNFYETINNYTENNINNKETMKYLYFLKEKKKNSDYN